MQPYRDANTDLIRALAILLVIVHHIGQFLTSLDERWLNYFKLGAYGVDLFFVLSGWLIGGLYWREYKKFGNVRMVHFWKRRWLRTLPPYFAVLPIAYLAVYFYRAEPFSWKYLFFLQNYNDTLPYFLISWSLCVEEHFYLFLPLLLLLLVRTKLAINPVFLIVIAISFISKFLDPSADLEADFGYSTTATHLRFEGLIIGVYFAYLANNKQNLWLIIQRLACKLLFPLLLGFLTIPFWSKWAGYYFGYGYVAIVWAALLATLTLLPGLKIATHEATKNIALWSYSIYLTHAMVINASIILSEKLSLPREVTFPIWFVLILLCGRCLYYLVEKPAMKLRDKWVPSRQV